MTSTSFTFDAAPADLAPYIARERQRDETNVVALKTRAARNSGVSFGGMQDYSGPPEPRSDAEIEEAARALMAKQLAWAASPRGRYYRACLDLQRAGYGPTAQRAIEAYDRGFSNAANLPCPREINSAMKDLLSVPPNDCAAAHPAAVACLALVAIAFEATPAEAA
ncbi:hypothetical protein [Phenylobacterium sp.]|uniref:hypothetical protein n=1 Tax=Phenylobacterium sp. TaxID=1871053 RepID=UPI002FCB0729